MSLAFSFCFLFFGNASMCCWNAPGRTNKIRIALLLDHDTGVEVENTKGMNCYSIISEWCQIILYWLKKKSFALYYLRKNPDRAVQIDEQTWALNHSIGIISLWAKFVRSTCYSNMTLILQSKNVDLIVFLVSSLFCLFDEFFTGWWSLQLEHFMTI